MLCEKCDKEATALNAIILEGEYGPIWAFTCPSCELFYKSVFKLELSTVNKDTFWPIMGATLSNLSGKKWFRGELARMFAHSMGELYEQKQQAVR